MKHIFTTLFSAVVALAYASIVHAVELQVDYPAVKGEDFSGGGPLAWLKYIYFGAFAIIGIVAFASLVYAGIKWMTSRSEGGVSDAKDRIQKTLLGLLLAGASFLILSLINPDLVRLREPNLPLPEAPERETGANFPDGNDPTDPQDVSDQLQTKCGEGEQCKSNFYCGLYEEESDFQPTIKRQTCLPKKAEGKECESNNECLSNICTVGECAKAFGTGTGVVFETHPNPLKAGVDQVVTHRMTMDKGVPNSSYGYSIDWGEVGRSPSTGSIPTNAQGFGDYNQYHTFRQPGTYTVTTTLLFNKFPVHSSSYQIIVVDIGGVFTPAPGNTTIEVTGETESVVAESAAVPLPTSVDITGPSTAATDGQTRKFTFLAFVNPGEKVYILASVGTLASSAKLHTANQSGTATAEVSVTFSNLCQQGAATTSGIQLRIQAARLSADGNTRSAWKVGTEIVNVTTPLCGQ